MDVDKIRQRIIRLVEGSNGRLTYKGASLAAGRNETYVQQFIRRGSPRRLPEDAREAIADYLGIEPDELRPDYPPRAARTAPDRFDEGLVRMVATVVLEVNARHGQNRRPSDLADTIARLCAFYAEEPDRGDLALMRDSIETVVRFTAPLSRSDKAGNV